MFIQGAVAGRADPAGTWETILAEGSGVLVDLRAAKDALYLSEYGWDQTAAGMRAIRAASPYQRVRDGVGYPAVLVHSGAEDYNFGPGQGAKYAARLQAANGGARPVLLDLDRHGGHDAYLFGPSEGLADAFAFALWQLGHPDFQP